MKSLKYIKSALLVLLCAGILTTSNICVEKVFAQPAQTQSQGQIQYTEAKPLSVVASPKVFLNKNIVMKAKFDKFSTLGLDYKPAMRSSEDYISFLIKRDDTSFNIPLSEMKLFLKRNLAEKFIDLKTDAWIDVKEIKLIKKAPETENKK